MDKEFISLFISKRGGGTRIKIVKELFKKPCNTNELSEILGFQYRTIKHHMIILLEEKIVEKEDKKYGALYNISEKMHKYKKDFDDLTNIYT